MGGSHGRVAWVASALVPHCDVSVHGAPGVGPPRHALAPHWRGVIWRQIDESGVKISLLTAMMLSEPFMPTRCWIAPEMPHAM